MIAETIAYLQGELLDDDQWFMRVDYAFTADPLGDDLLSETPALMIYPASFNGLGRASDSRVDQREEQVIGLQLVCKIDEFEARRRQVLASLMGYQYDSTATMFEFVSGEVKGMRASLVWFEMQFSCEAPAGL